MWWNRLNARLGLCLALVNGLAYLVLLSFVIFNFSYWTAQVATSDDESRLIKLLNRMGRDSETTGFAQIARAIDPMPDVVFQGRRFCRAALAKSAVARPAGGLSDVYFAGRTR